MNPFFRHIYYYSSSQGVLAEYQAILNAAAAAGITTIPEDTQDADQTFIETGLSQGWWALADGIWIFHYNDTDLADFSTLNWKSPANNRMTHNTSTGTYGVKGWKWNGSTNQGDLNFNPSTNGVNYQQDAASLIAYVETIPTTGTAILGYSNGITNRLRSANSALMSINSGIDLVGGAVDMTGTGYRAINRSTSSAVQLYSGTTKSDRTATSGSLTDDRIRVGRLGVSGTLDRSDVEVGAVIIGGSLTEAQHNQIRAALIARRTAIGL